MNTNPRTRRMVTAALFAAVITVVTAYFLHIPIPTGGYLHMGDTFIYLAASILPAPYAVFAASVGAGLADLLTAPVWVLPTVLIKAVVALQFTCRKEKFLCTRNVIATLATLIVSPTLYSLANCVIAKSWAAFIPQFWPTMIQAAASGAAFFVLGFLLDEAHFGSRAVKMLGE